MKAKLTLRLNKNVIDKAKKFAKKNNQSLSILVENYFNIMSEKDVSPDNDISPNVLELSGIIKLKENFDLKKEYRRHFTEKYR